MHIDIPSLLSKFDQLKEIIVKVILNNTQIILYYYVKLS